MKKLFMCGFFLITTAAFTKELVEEKRPLGRDPVLLSDGTKIESIWSSDNVQVTQIKQTDGRICYAVINVLPQSGSSNLGFNCVPK